MSIIKEEFNDKQFEGKVFDLIKFVEDGEVELADGTKIIGKKGEEIELPISYNLVVDSFSKLIATLLKGDTSYFNNLYWEVGSGNEQWSDASPPSPIASDESLLAPLFRKKINKEDVEYLDSSGKVTTAITNRLQMSALFKSTESNGYLREFGIFAGGNSTLGSGIMINRKTHGVIFKSTGVELHRKIQFKF